MACFEELSTDDDENKERETLPIFKTTPCCMWTYGRLRLPLSNSRQVMKKIYGKGAHGLYKSALNY
jgi:hypothetical protein